MGNEKRIETAKIQYPSEEELRQAVELANSEHYPTRGDCGHCRGIGGNSAGTFCEFCSGTGWDSPGVTQVFDRYERALRDAQADQSELTRLRAVVAEFQTSLRSTGDSPMTPIEEILSLASAMTDQDRATLLVLARALRDGRINNEYLSGSVYLAMHPEVKR